MWQLLISRLNIPSAYVWGLLQNGPYCTVTPPNVASDALMMFDDEIRQYLSLCAAIEVANDVWCQAQLGHKHGGLGLRSLSQHAAPVYFVTLASLSFGSAGSIHLKHAVAVFNSQASLSITITLESALTSYHPEALVRED